MSDIRNIFKTMSMLELIDTEQPYQPISFYNYCFLCHIDDISLSSYSKVYEKRITGYNLWVLSIDEPNRCFLSCVYYPKKHKKGQKIKVIYRDSFTGFRVVDWVHGKPKLYEYIIQNVMALYDYIFYDFHEYNEAKVLAFHEWAKYVKERESEVFGNRKTININLIEQLQFFH